MTDVTRILNAIEGGDRHAADTLIPIVYDELRRMASRKLSREHASSAFQTTALVHEAYLRLVGSGDPGWANRRHFFGAAAEAMRRILIDRARRRQALKRGGDRQHVSLDSIRLGVEPRPDELLALAEALAKLAEQDSLKAELVKLRYFAGLTAEDAARAIGVSPATARRYWAYARAWLRVELSSDGTKGQ
jgi:RNA polymerase sigma factor (TIGR02999 family)